MGVQETSIVLQGNKMKGGSVGLATEMHSTEER